MIGPTTSTMPVPAPWHDCSAARLDSQTPPTLLSVGLAELNDVAILITGRLATLGRLSSAELTLYAGRSSVQHVSDFLSVRPVQPRP